MIRKNLMKSLSVIMAAMLAVMTVACGQNTVTDTTAVTTQAQSTEADALAGTLVSASNVMSGESKADKVETVYVTADANGAVNDVIVSEWLKNAESTAELSDTTQLHDIVNVKGSETYKDNGDGTLTWDAEGSDIYYQGTTDKQLPVSMKITYTLDGKEISPEELAGKSGKVTMRFAYQNNDKKTVNVNGKDVDVYTPFAMVSGMMLDSEKFSNVEISNGKVISDGGNIIVMGVAVPGLKESLDISEDKWDELDNADEIKDKLSDSFEITADTTDFELGMTITMASSDILSDFGMEELSGSDKIDELKDNMEELNDGATRLVDGSRALKDGTGELKDGTGKLYEGTTKLSDGASDLFDGTVKLFDGTHSLFDGTDKLYAGTGSLFDGTGKLCDGTGKLYDGAGKLYDGTRSLTDGASTLEKGIVSYTDGASQIKAGAGQLKSGVAAAKAGSEKLVAGTESAETNAKTLAAGAGQVSEGVKLIQTMMTNMKKASEKLSELKTKQGLYGAAYAWLTNTSDTDSEPSAEVLAILNSIDGGISSGHEAVKIKKAALAALTGQTTSSLYVINNYEELVTVVETGVLYADGSDQEQEKTEEEPAQAPEQIGEAPEAEEPSETPAAEENAPSDEESSETPQEEAQETEQVEEAQETEQVEEAQDTLSSTGNETKTVVVKAAATGYTDGDVAVIAGYVKRYSVMCGATSAAAQALGQAYDEISSMTASVFSEETAGKIDELVAGAEAVANGTTLLAGGLGEIKTGQQGLDAGIGQVSAGVSSLYDGADKLTANNAALTGGAKQLSGGAGQLQNGAGELKSGVKDLKDGAGQLRDGAGELRDGAGQLRDGAGQLRDGAGELKDGAGQLKDGAKELNDGAKELDDGAAKLDEGVQELYDGMVKFDEEGIRKLYDLFDGDLSEFTDRLSAIKEAGTTYKSFGGSSDDTNSSVKFIIRTDSVKSL